MAYGVLGIAAIILSLSGYWLKCMMGIDFSENYSLSKYFPFSYLLPKKVISNPAPGILLDDSFDSFSLFGNWTPLWMREKGKVSKGYDSNGIDNSRCLLIKSISAKSWSCSHRKMIEVREGDVFTYKVYVQLLGDNLSAQAGVSTFDKNMSVIAWNYFTKRTYLNNNWILLEKTFMISQKTSYIQFSLTGNGVGAFRFDDVHFDMVALSTKTHASSGSI